MQYDALIQKVREAVPALIALYQFGSHAQGNARLESDVDLALLAQPALSPVTRLTLREELSVLLHRDVDLVDLQQASTVLRMQVISTGKVLLSADDCAREQFETIVYASYARLNEERRGILDDIRARGRVYAG
jgi:uncharacterized protein